MFRIPERGRHITQEPQIIATQLVGAPLATFRRRTIAIAIDTVLFGLLMGALFLGLTAWSFHRADPTLIPRMRAMAEPATETTEAQQDKVLADFHYQVLQRCPEAYPREVAQSIRNRDVAAIAAYFSRYNTVISLGNGRTRTIENEDGTNQMIVGMDLLMGRFSGLLGWGGLFVAWFTLWLLVTRGRSPGKLLLRLKVIRLDGKRVRLWDCFSRSAGYSASAATLMLGFLEAIWHPNRQAIHDKIAGTVVVRG